MSQAGQCLAVIRVKVRVRVGRSARGCLGPGGFLLGVRGVDQDDPGDIRRAAMGEDHGLEPARRMTDHDKRTGNGAEGHKGLKIRGRVLRILRLGTGVAETEAGPVLGADPGCQGQGRMHGLSAEGGVVESRRQNHRGGSFSEAEIVQPASRGQLGGLLRRAVD